MTATPPDEPLNPAIASIRASLRPALPKRFYKQATAGERDGGFTVLLDGRPIRTPARKPVLVSERMQAEALAAEWSAQAEQIDPAQMPLTRIVNSALDGVTGREAEVAAEIVKYAGGDLLLYRADGPAALVARQARHWDPVVAWAEGFIGGRFILGQGIMPVAQPLTTLDRLAAKTAGLDALTLSGLHVVTTLTGSALLALAVAEGHLSVDEAWVAAHVDEDHQIEMWGEDGEARTRRDLRRREMHAAAILLA